MPFLCVLLFDERGIGLIRYSCSLCCVTRLRIKSIVGNAALDGSAAGEKNKGHVFFHLRQHGHICAVSAASKKGHYPCNFPIDPRLQCVLRDGLGSVFGCSSSPLSLASPRLRWPLCVSSPLLPFCRDLQPPSMHSGCPNLAARAGSASLPGHRLVGRASHQCTNK